MAFWSQGRRQRSWDSHSNSPHTFALWTESGLHKVIAERAIMELKRPSPLIATVQSWWRFLNANHECTYCGSIESSPPWADGKDLWMSRPVRAMDGKSIVYWTELFQIKRTRYKMQCFWAPALTHLISILHALVLSRYLFHDGLRPQAGQTMRRLTHNNAHLQKKKNRIQWNSLSLSNSIISWRCEEFRLSPPRIWLNSEAPFLKYPGAATVCRSQGRRNWNSGRCSPGNVS